MQNKPKKSPIYKNIVFWFLILVVLAGILGIVIGEDLPDWLEFVRRLLRTNY
ncbi:hypothetical protein [Ornithinibacillus xuwenensis]|uniref:DNA-directed RNA polymerase subunit beta n=1 Tax=Ornithinibacillus xuwenensis TaxID=3144668 RepID=A0ABU9XGQ1_9BACI